jgi:hypothetical protein
MTSSRLAWASLGSWVLVLGCGPGQLPGIEGFSDGFGEEVGESETSDPTETGDPTDPTETTDPTDPTETTDPTDPIEECPQLELPSSASVFLDDFFDVSGPSSMPAQCLDFGFDAADRTITWTAPQTGEYSLSAFGFEAFVSVGVVEGICGGPLLACGGDFGGVFFAFAGQTYTFVVEGELSTPYQLFVELNGVTSSCPVGELGGVEGNVVDATQGSSGFSPSCVEGSGPEDGWMFVPPFAGTYRFDTAASTFDTVLEVVQGECGGPSLGCVDDVVDSLQSAIEVELEAGELYTIFVDGYGGDSGSYQLAWQLISEAPNLCDSAELLPSQLPFALTWGGGETSGNEFGGCADFPNERRFRWTAPQDATIQISQQTLDAAGALSVFQTGCDNLAGFECVSSFDTAAHLLAVTAGQELLIVSEYASGSPVELTIDEAGSVGCGQALPAGVPVSTMGTTNGAGDDFMGSCAFNPSPEREFWWTAPATGSYRIDTIGSNFDTLLHVRSGGCEGNELACDDDLGGNLTSLVDVDLLAGQTISIFVDGFNGSGSFVLNIDAN